ncbi:unnamed protein product [Mucor hiemalis]
MTSVLTDPPTHVHEDDKLETIDEDDMVKVSKTNELVSAYVDNPCYLCHKMLSSPGALISHLDTIHKVKLTPRAKSRGRPRSTKYHFVSKSGQHRRILFGCPSCWFHCPKNFQRLRTHIKEAHLDEDGLGFEEPEDEEGDLSEEEKSSYSTATYMVAQLDELSARLKSILGFA